MLHCLNAAAATVAQKGRGLKNRFQSWVESAHIYNRILSEIVMEAATFEVFLARDGALLGTFSAHVRRVLHEAHSPIGPRGLHFLNVRHFNYINK